MGRRMQQLNHEWLPQPWRVVGNKRENFETVTLEIVPVNPNDAFRMQPGQFNMVYGFGLGEIPISVSGWSERGLLHTIRSVGAVSKNLSEKKNGDTIGIRGPFGQGWPSPQTAMRT